MQANTLIHASAIRESAQLNGNLIHTGKSHMFFRMSPTHMCVCMGIHACQRINVTGNDMGSSHLPRFFMLVCLLYAYLYTYIRRRRTFIAVI